MSNKISDEIVRNIVNEITQEMDDYYNGKKNYLKKGEYYCEKYGVSYSWFRDMIRNNIDKDVRKVRKSIISTEMGEKFGGSNTPSSYELSNRQIQGHTFEKDVKKYLEKQGYDVVRIFESDDGFRYFNENGINRYSNELCRFLYSLSCEGCFLPDFICFSNGEVEKFVEVKLSKDVKIKPELREGINRLKERGFEVEIIRGD